MHSDNTPPNNNHIRHHNHDTYVTVTEAARLAHVSTSAIYKWIRHGRITSHRFPNGARQWLKLADLGPAVDAALDRATPIAA